MNWIREIEKSRRLLITGIIIICVATLAVTARRDPVSFDIFWHVKMGLDWMLQGLSPWVDRYSFLAEGQAVSPPVVFQVIVASMVHVFGLEHGLQLFKFLATLLTLGLFAWFLRQLRSPAVIYLLLLPLLVTLLQMRAITRPELLTYAFSVAAVMLYHHAGGKVSPRTILPIAALMLLWNNYHSSVFGYVIFFGLFVDAALSLLKDRARIREWLAWGGLGALLLLIGFINPTFEHPVIAAASFAPEWKTIIVEYMPTIDLYRAHPPFYALTIVTALSLFLAIRQRKAGYAIVLLVLIFNASQVSRLITPSGVVVLGLLASMLSDIDFEKAPSTTGGTGIKVLASVLALVAVLSLGHSVYTARQLMFENQAVPENFPRAIVDYMEENSLEGRIFNDFEVGGYLAYRMHPGSQVYIDGRSNILYSLEQYSHFMQAKSNPVDLLEELDRYGIDYAVLRADRNTMAIVHDTRQFQLEFADNRYALFKRGQGQFSLSGRLLGYPACWNEAALTGLEAEFQGAIWTVPASSFLIGYLQTVLDYARSESPGDYLNGLKKQPSLHSHILKFSAYQALNLGMYEESIEFFSRFSGWVLGDYLAFAAAMIGLGDWQEAEKVLDEATSIAWQHVTPRQTVLLYRMLTAIGENSELSLFSGEYLDGLSGNLPETGRDSYDLELDYALFCSE